MTVLEQLKKTIQDNIFQTLEILYPLKNIELSIPPNENLGDYAFSCFDLAKGLGKNPAEIATALAKSWQKHDLVKQAIAAGPYLNISVKPDNFIKNSLEQLINHKNFGHINVGNGKKILIEFSGPNTNKPQHLGHARNNILGQAIVNIFRSCNWQVIPVNIVNDRGIHIIKSMLAWQKFGNGETPESTGIKGDHLVGKYYVKFEQELKAEKAKYLADNKIDLAKLSDLEKKDADAKFLTQSSLMNEAQNMLQAWENNDPEVKKLWQTMNDWVYHGFAETYQALGISFDKVYYESQTYLAGKELVKEGLNKNIFYQKDDSSVWVDLSEYNLEEKLLLRKDGTAVYMTQDLGTAKMRFDEFGFAQGVYVVANEQIHHFQVLFATLKKLGFTWANNLYHLAYGMVNLPEGKMKSREGTVVDTDDIIQEMQTKAQEIMDSADKKKESSAEEKTNIAKIVGLGALKFFMLGANPQKDITFDPKKSISFDGYTGTFVQYTHARINNILIKESATKGFHNLDFKTPFATEEIKLAKTILDFPEKIKKSCLEYNPSILTQYLFDLAKTFNNFYQNHSILQAENDNLKNIRLHLCQQTKNVLAKGLDLLGIDAPKTM